MADFWLNEANYGITAKPPYPVQSIVKSGLRWPITLVTPVVQGAPVSGPVFPSAATITTELFYTDYYERIWVSPSVMRLANPRLNTAIPFDLWNAYRADNTLEAVDNTELNGVTVTGPIPTEFEGYEYRPMAFQIGNSAGASLDGSLVFDFTYGLGYLRIIAKLTELVSLTPEVPLTEVWAWNTIVNPSYAGKEQRQALRINPRIRLQYNLVIETEADRRRTYNQLFTYLIRDIQLPLHAYAARLIALAGVGATRLLFDTATTNMQVGYGAVFNMQTETFTLFEILSVEADGITLLNPLDTAYGLGSIVVPAIACRIPNNSAINMRSVSGDFELSAESTEPRNFLRPGQSTTLLELDGFPILIHRPLADNDVDEEFLADFETIDNGLTKPAAYSAWDHTQIKMERTFKTQRPAGMDWWRAFAYRLVGRQNAFLLPTFRQDLTLRDNAALGSNALVVNESDYATKWLNASYKRLMIQTANGTIYRSVVNVVEVTGGLQLNLSAPLGSTIGDNTIRVISFLNLARLDSDDITLDHYPLETFLTLTIQTVDL